MVNFLMFLLKEICCTIIQQKPLSTTLPLEEENMSHLNIVSESIQVKNPSNPSDIEKRIDACKEQFNLILSEILEGENQEAHKMEGAIFQNLMKLGLLLLQLFFANHNQGNYGEILKTARGIARRGRPNEKSYFSIFGKIKVNRYLYHIGEESFAPLDIFLNLPRRCYSYFLSEMVNFLDIKGAYVEGSKFLEKFFGLKLSVSALETISCESSVHYDDYYDLKNSRPKEVKKEDFTVVGFDGKGVPMIKKEAAKIKGRQGKGEKRQKKKEALVGVRYQVNAHIRSAEEVAANLVYPEKKKEEDKSKPEGKGKNIRYIASLERPKKQVMRVIKDEIIEEDFSKNPLVCVMDGAKYLWQSFGEIFKEVKNKVLILDIIHALEYIWLIAHAKYKEGSEEAAEYVYEKLQLILEGKVASYIMELQSEMLNENLSKSKENTFIKVITYFKNHRQYMKYEEYLARGYPIGSGVVESACGHVIKDRMEITGARWGISGAEAILKLRSILKSNDWDSYWEFFTDQAKNNEFFPDNDNPLSSQKKLVA